MILINGALTDAEKYIDHVMKFGRTPDIDGSDTNEEVWDGTGAYPGFLAAAATHTVSSSSTDDVATTGSGAWTLRVQGLNAAFEQISQDVSLNGQTGVSLPTDLIRVYRAYVLTSGVDTTNAGDIWVGTGAISSGVPAVKNAGVLAGNGQTLMAVYTIPTLYDTTDLGGGFVDRFYGSAGNVASARSTIALQTRVFGGGWRSRRVAEIGVGAMLDETLGHGLYLPVKTDIRVRVLENGQNNTTITAGFDLHLY